MHNSLRKMRGAFAVVTALLFLNVSAGQAENGCPAGYEPWKIPVETINDCMAIPDYGQDAEGAEVPVLQDEGIWQSRWGAIVTGKSKVGTVVGISEAAISKHEAEVDALRQCQSQGGFDCDVEIVFYNQCGTIVWGDGYSYAARAATVSRAEEIALAGCAELTSNCKVYYTSCSYPVRVR